MNFEFCFIFWNTDTIQCMAIDYWAFFLKTNPIQGSTNADYAARVHRFFEKYQKKPAQPIWPPGKEDLTKNDYEDRYSLRDYKVRGNWKLALSKHLKGRLGLPVCLSVRKWVLHFFGKKHSSLYIHRPKAPTLLRAQRALGLGSSNQRPRRS